MFDQVQPHIALERTQGRAAVELCKKNGATQLRRLWQSGSAKAFLPRIHGPVPEVVFLNTAGGLTGGDRMEHGLSLDAGCHAVATTQTAERAYASRDGFAGLEVDLVLGSGASLDWLPQETILFNRSALRRTTDVRLSGSARFMMAETVILGRHAMGEEMTAFEFRDRRRITRDGAPVLTDPQHLEAGALALRSACLGAARAFATVIMIDADDRCQALRDRLRAAFPLDGVEAAVSAWDGKCVARLAGADAQQLKQGLVHALAALRGTPLPRVWQI